MEDMIYVVFFIIYILFAILKKVAEKKSIDKNTSSDPSKKAPGPIKDIFARLEEIKRQQEMAAKQPQVPNAAEKMEQPAPYSAQAQQAPAPAAPELKPVPKQSEKQNEYASQQKFSYDEMESLEQRIQKPVSSEKAFQNQEISFEFEEEYEESYSTGFSFTKSTDLQKAFVWKEVFDKPLALRR